MSEDSKQFSIEAVILQSFYLLYHMLNNCAHKNLLTLSPCTKRLRFGDCYWFGWWRSLCWSASFWNFNPSPGSVLTRRLTILGIKSFYGLDHMHYSGAVMTPTDVMMETFFGKQYLPRCFGIGNTTEWPDSFRGLLGNRRNAMYGLPKSPSAITGATRTATHSLISPAA